MEVAGWRTNAGRLPADARGVPLSFEDVANAVRNIRQERITRGGFNVFYRADILRPVGIDAVDIRRIDSNDPGIGADAAQVIVAVGEDEGAATTGLPRASPPAKNLMRRWK